MAKDAVATMGDVLPPDAGGRDAVHVAVFSAQAYTAMYPGEAVAIVREDGTDVFVTRKASKDEDLIGIVDPFIKSDIPVGSRFWVYLYPRTITSLSHRWGHPAFADASATSTYVPPSQKVSSELWLREFCAASDCPDYDTLLEVIKNGELIRKVKGDRHEREYDGYIDGDFIHFSGRDAHGEIPPEFWTHVENVLGEKMTSKPSYFSCSC